MARFTPPRIAARKFIYVRAMFCLGFSSAGCEWQLIGSLELGEEQEASPTPPCLEKIGVEARDVGMVGRWHSL
jgi:hypothetical protein